MYQCWAGATQFGSSKFLEPLQFQFGLAKLELDLARLIFRTGSRTRKETR